MRPLLRFACTALMAGTAFAPLLADPAPPATPAPAAVAPRPAPRLVLAIAVDQFSADLFAQYRETYRAGLAKLLTGAVFPSGFQSHAATETCPGHSTIMTGAHPARTGIISNNWFVPGIARADKRVYCSEDLSDPASTSRDPVVSAGLLKVPTLGELVKAANPASRNVAVSAKDRAVVMMGGHVIDAGYWWKGDRFVTFKGVTPVAAAMTENSQIAGVLAKGAGPLALPPACARYDRAVAAGPAGAIGRGRFALEPNKPDLFRVSPRMDAATVDLAGRLVDQLNLGKGAATDVLSVSLSATDYIGHAVGNEGAEMCIQMAALDQSIGRLLAHLDARGIDYAVVLTADHGGLDAPERLDEQALPRAVRVDPALTPGALAKAIGAQLGLSSSGPLLLGDAPFGDLYWAASLSPAQKEKATAALLARLRAHPQVAAAFSHAELAGTPMPAGNPQDWTIRERARASFDNERSGDVVVLLDRAVVPIVTPAPGYTATHGSVFDYDRRVPMLFWRKGMPGFEQPAPVETVDIAPTLAALIGLKVPEGQFDGRCLDLDPGTGNTCTVAP
ncbi:alkaline phosphatase family protein [Parablastomonas sp. CN1-191]|uniref:alkaline phosphatase family protein n=1 Tax=Parablastomonas sp. CN1-191 TaxID=3400908 RepID=UPI003BF88A2B